MSIRAVPGDGVPPQKRRLVIEKDAGQREYFDVTGFHVDDDRCVQLLAPGGQIDGVFVSGVVGVWFADIEDGGQVPLAEAG